MASTAVVNCSGLQAADHCLFLLKKRRKCDWNWPCKNYLAKNNVVIGETVNWQGEGVEAEIIALSESTDELNEKHLFWSKKNLEETSQVDSISAPNKHPKKRSRLEKSNAKEKVAKTKDTTKPPSTTTAEVVDLSKEEEKTNSNASTKTNDNSATPLSAQKDHVAGDRYKEFLKEQKKREEDLAAKHKRATKKLNLPDSSHDVIMKKLILQTMSA
ncbi:unnamed protein product [Porites evermanni]|uniref:Uncharacterized protein n=1 Tax=Porites evermanni TaxID=104178 RepID=A0ABN8NA06_9CNID|nr:unnamed protein product [Porites evermanni]